MSFNVKKKITDQTIRELLCCAIDPGHGGSYYWCNLVEYDIKPPLEFKDFCEKGKMQLKQYWHPCQLIPLVEDCAILIHDREDGAEDSPLLRLDRAAIQKGVQVMADEYPRHFANALSDGDMDADTGDVFLQCCLFEEIVYG